MKKTILMTLCCTALMTRGASLNLSSSSVDLTGVSTSLDSFSDVLSVTANESDNVLVIGTFSTEASTTISGAAQWRLNYGNGSQISKPIQRTLDNKKDKGIASVAHVFTGVTSGNPINLEHSGLSGVTLTTFGVNLVAIPLKVSTTGEPLNYGMHQQSSGSNVTSTVFAETGVETTVTLARATGNRLYMAASFNSQATVTAPETGVWKLQYRKVSGDWIDTESPVSRSMGSTSDIGAITLYGLEEGLETGTYGVRLVCRSTNGNTVQTLNGTLVAVALSYTNATVGGYFDGFSVNSTTLNKISETPYGAPQANLNVVTANSGVFASMNFSASADAGSKTVAFDLCVTNGISHANYANQSNERFFTDAGDSGSGGSAGYFSGLTVGTWTLHGRYEHATAVTITFPAVTLVGFATVARTDAGTGTTSSGIDLRAYDTAQGVVVEFTAYDVEEDGEIKIALLDDNGVEIWSGVAAVTAGAEQTVQMLVPGLVAGESYSFRVRDEVGKVWTADNVTVGAFTVRMVRAPGAGAELMFNSVPGRTYDIQWTGELGGEWQTVDSVTAGETTYVVVPYPAGEEGKGFFRIQLK